MRITALCGCKTDYEIGFERVSPTNDKERPYLKTVKEIHYCTKHEPTKSINQYEIDAKPLPPPSCESLRRRYIAYAMRRLRPLTYLSVAEAMDIVYMLNMRMLDTKGKFVMSYPDVKFSAPNEAQAEGRFKRDPVKIKITSEQIAPDKAHINVDVIRDDEWGV